MSDARIDISSINPLVGTPSDTLSQVSAVLEVLCVMRPDVCEASDFRFGMYLIHWWLKSTLTFLNEHPGVRYVVPVAGGEQ
jgi:hypothetical protein